MLPLSSGAEWSRASAHQLFRPLIPRQMVDLTGRVRFFIVDLVSFLLAVRCDGCQSLRAWGALSLIIVFDFLITRLLATATLPRRYVVCKNIELFQCHSSFFRRCSPFSPDMSPRHHDCRVRRLADVLFLMFFRDVFVSVRRVGFFLPWCFPVPHRGAPLLRLDAQGTQQR